MRKLNEAENPGSTPGRMRLRRTYDIDESIPSSEFLQLSNKSGDLSLESTVSLQFLRQYHALAGAGNRQAERQLSAGKPKSQSRLP